MKKEEIHLEDFKRILFGQAPPEFLLETFIRTLIIYIVLLFIVRWLGKRMIGQLTIMELAVMLTLGAIVSVPMQVPDRGLLQGALLLVCAVFFQRGISLIGFRRGKFEDIAQGKTSLLVKDGVLQLEQMEKDRISRQQIYAELRQQKIFNLGMVDRLYAEAEGVFSVFKSNQPKSGLPILPPDDQEIMQIQHQASTQPPQSIQLMVCVSCGLIKPQSQQDTACNHCGHDEWVNAIN
ncbi:DUF421 domain-containing protein [Mucilaginibacter robiniae]|uniref:DUF421 domain-containing protein n=1 Tax=Mucilaginibacter robiniae TaxID=2728022 RepID=A0A7L5E0F5_9SPHI|nr:YetF domain-containing protein [Mucilaginibacter robiniae]QJD96852.1 DUF421 domain-containing protein [Mucilaginibacter robiniae]